ncbi:hypothetical protein EAH80_21690 [Mycobacterium hodleri]|uniref:Uncharacterized protein n=2 Tax=Mycolicibacterium hodleri TaxID=49897 RepID=A0A502E5H6_9MYCO|nr:hypothetical protein EAH80_21690 [Mycolicibacterium hodleri]
MPAIANADPIAPQSNTSCSADFAGAMTWPTGDQAPLVCEAERWVPVADPYPISDRWLSYGPAMTLHGEGRRNPTLLSGDWTATPLTAESACAATQLTVISGSPTVGPPAIDEGKPGQTLELAVLPSLFTIELSGDCLWQRSR